MSMVAMKQIHSNHYPTTITAVLLSNQLVSVMKVWDMILIQIHFSRCQLSYAYFQISVVKLCHNYRILSKGVNDLSRLATIQL